MRVVVDGHLNNLAVRIEIEDLRRIEADFGTVGQGPIVAEIADGARLAPNADKYIE